MKYLPIIAMCVLLAACDHTQKPNVNVISPTAPITVPTVDPVENRPVQWKVYNIERLKALINELTASGEDTVLFTLDENNFKALNSNLVDIDTHIGQQKEVIDFLTKAIKANEAATKTATDAASKKDEKVEKKK